MATVTKFVDKTNGNDANDGLDNIGVGLATATWEEATLTLTQNGHGYTFAAGDCIYLASGTGLTPGLYEVASSTANTITLAATSSIPRVGDGNDVAAGDDATGDWTSSTGPLQTLDAAMNAVLAVDDTMFYCVAGADYGAFAIDTAVASTHQTCTFEGYTTTPGDDGRITVKGTLTDTIATRIHYCFKNIIFDGEDVRACVSLSSYEIMWRNCDFISSTAGDGVTVGQANWFWDCYFEGAALDLIACGALGAFFNCRFYNAGAAGIDCSSTVLCWNCTFYNCEGNAIDGGAVNDSHVIAINCTIDGNAQTTNTGVYKNPGYRGMIAVINCIIYDCTTGEHGTHGERDLLIYNLFNNNTADHGGNGSDQEGTFQTGAPDFVNEVAGADYTLNSASPAVGAGHDEDNNMDIGSHQLVAGGGGGGLLMPNKRGNKQ